MLLFGKVGEKLNFGPGCVVINVGGTELYAVWVNCGFLCSPTMDSGDQ